MKVSPGGSFAPLARSLAPLAWGRGVGGGGGVRAGKGSEGRQGEQDPRVWLRLEGCQRLPRLPDAPAGKEEWGGKEWVRGSKGNNALKTDWGFKAAEGSQGCLRPQGKELWGELGKGELEARGARRTRPLSLIEAPRLPKAVWGPKGLQGSRGWAGENGVRWSQGSPRLPKVPKAPGDQRCLEGEEGGERSKGWGGKAPESDWGSRGPMGTGRPRRQGRGTEGEQGEQGLQVWLRPQGCQRLPRQLKASWGHGARESKKGKVPKSEGPWLLKGDKGRREARVQVGVRGMLY